MMDRSNPGERRDQSPPESRHFRDQNEYYEESRKQSEAESTQVMNTSAFGGQSGHQDSGTRGVAKKLTPLESFLTHHDVSIDEVQQSVSLNLKGVSREQFIKDVIRLSGNTNLVCADLLKALSKLEKGAGLSDQISIAVALGSEEKSIAERNVSQLGEKPMTDAIAGHVVFKVCTGKDLFMGKLAQVKEGFVGGYGDKETLVEYKFTGLAKMFPRLWNSWDKDNLIIGLK